MTEYPKMGLENFFNDHSLNIPPGDTQKIPEAKKEITNSSYEVGSAEYKVKGQDRILFDQEKGLFLVVDGRNNKGAEYAESLKQRAQLEIEGFRPNTLPATSKAEAKSQWKLAAEQFVSRFQELAKKEGGEFFETKYGLFGKKGTYTADAAAALTLLAPDGQGLCAVAGDCAVYVFRSQDGSIHQLSVPTYRLSGSGRQSAGGLVGNSPEMHQTNFELSHGDTLLICSDGLLYNRENSNGLRLASDPEIRKILGGNLPVMNKAESLARKAGGGQKGQLDDISLLLVSRK